MSVYHVHAWCLHRPQDGSRFPETRVTGVCELPWECWEINMDPLEEHPERLTAEASLQPPDFFFIFTAVHVYLFLCLWYMWVHMCSHDVRFLRYCSPPYL